MSKPILIVGAGPTGLMAALELARRQVPIRIIDAGTGPTPEHESRALALHGRSLDLFKRNGLEAKMLAVGNKVLGVDLQANGRPVAQLDFSDAGAARSYICVIPQGTTERILIDALEQRDVHVEWQTTCLSVDSLATPRVALSHHADQTASHLEPAHVIGADGAHSAVRRAIGATFEGETVEETFGLVDVRTTKPVDPTRFVANRQSTGMLGRIPINDRVVRYITDRPDIGEVLPDDPGVDDIIWSSTFRVSYRHVDTFQRGQVFLMGDAAHLHSPAGGRGMNLGLEDAAWFAHAYENGLLDGYTAARLPEARHTLKISKRMMNNAVSNNLIANAAFRYVLPVMLGFGPVKRNITRLILAEERPRPAFHD